MRKSKNNNATLNIEKQLSIGLLGASFNTDNFGVAALACGAVDAICHSHPKAHIFLVDYAQKPATYDVLHSSGSAKVELFNIRFSKKFYFRNNIAYLIGTAVCFRIIPLRKWKNRLIQKNRILKIIHEADLIGSIAGGDSFSDIYGFSRLIYVALPQILVLLLGKPLVLLPQTIGPFKSLFGRTLARFLIRSAQKVYSRDKEGLDKARETAPDARCRMAFCYDLGFILEPRILVEKIPQFYVNLNRGIKIVGLNVSGLLYMGGYTRKNMFGLKGDYRRLILDLIDHFVIKYNAHFMLVPHVIGSIENGENDTIACHKIYDESEHRLQKHLHIISRHYDQHELKSLISRCDFFIGSRMHACIAALSQCVPAVGLAYSRKFRGVFASIGVEELVLDLRKLESNYLIESVGQKYEHRRHFRKQLKVKIPSVLVTVRELFAQISTDCRTNPDLHSS